MARVIDQFVFNINVAARDTDNNKLHNEKTPQPTKGQRYDRLNRKRIFQTSWKEKISLFQASGRLILITLAIKSRWN